MIFEEDPIDQKQEIISISISYKSNVTNRSVMALRFKELEGTLEICTFSDSEYFSYLENLLLQWETFQSVQDDVQLKNNLILNIGEHDQDKVTKIISTSSADWKFSFNVNFQKMVKKVGFVCV